MMKKKFNKIKGFLIYIYYTCKMPFSSTQSLFSFKVILWWHFSQLNVLVQKLNPLQPVAVAIFKFQIKFQEHSFH